MCLKCNYIELGYKKLILDKMYHTYTEQCHLKVGELPKETRKKSKYLYRYCVVIRQDKGNGYEDVETFISNSKFIPIDKEEFDKKYQTLKKADKSVKYVYRIIKTERNEQSPS